jgi:ribosomal protein S18 acetylase RimI-like enzyme
MDVQRVQIDAAPDVLSILRDAALWVDSKGIDQWRDFLDLEKAERIVNKRFIEGEVFLGYLEGIPAATITLQWKDEFWSELGNDPSAGYIHTMAVQRSHAGRAFGRELLDWAEDYFKKVGRVKTRLDCIEGNVRLCRFYDDQDFKTIGRKDWNGVGLVMKERIY